MKTLIVVLVLVALLLLLLLAMAVKVIKQYERGVLFRFGRLAGTKLENPDLVGLAESFGLAGLRAESADQVTPMLRRALDLDVPSVVEIPIDYRENVRFSQRLADFGEVEEGVV